MTQLHDVGNIILGGGSGPWIGNYTAAHKVWSASELKKDGDFFLNSSTNSDAHDSSAAYPLLFFCNRGNPALVYGGFVEVALMFTMWHAVICNTNVQHVTYEDLEIAYAGGDGIFGVNVSDLVIRRCDLQWIGGGCLIPGPRWPRDPLECTRFGNGIEFPDFGHDSGHKHYTHNVSVHENRLWEVYDAALSPQGAGSYVQRNLSFHHNLVWHAEYCFEIWSHGPTNQSTLEAVYFDNNVCVDSGGGWSHPVRPDPSGRHICSFATAGNVSRISLRNNIFFQRVPYQAAWWMSDGWGKVPCSKGTCGWQGSFVTDNNIWFQADASLGQLFIIGTSGEHYFNYSAHGLAAWHELTGSGTAAILADPLLRGLPPPHRPTTRVGPETSLRPMGSSPALRAGVWTGVGADFAGAPIPQSSPDIGAYQVSSAAPAPAPPPKRSEHGA